MKRFRFGVTIGGFWHITVVARTVDAIEQVGINVALFKIGVHDGMEPTRGVKVFVRFDQV